LFVEKKYLDEERRNAEERKAKKRKAVTQGGRTAKRPALGPATPNSSTQLLADVEVEDNEDDTTPDVLLRGQAVNEEERRLAYGQSERPDSEVGHGQPKNTLTADQINSIVDDFVNAETHGFKCRWKVPTLYFGNDKFRE
jgi:hypothetical protein